MKEEEEVRVRKYPTILDVDSLSDEETRWVKHFMKEAILGYFRETIDAKVDECFDLLKGRKLDEQDNIIFRFDIETIAADFLTMIGAAKNQIDAGARFT